jgi:iron complex outermembrane receptor protein
VIQTYFVIVCWLLPLSAAGQESETGEPTPTPSLSAVAPPVAADQMLKEEFEFLQETIIESASKRSESVFASPLSSDVVTRDMIQKAGARSIPEALRLLPGMIVREQTSGNFDVHIRGMDNIPPGSRLQYFISTTVLVMIDYRVVYNYLQGGTYWEALPIDIVDVERIELVRGPVAALYGPNAVTGVINIITRKLTSNGLHASAQAESTGQQGWKDNFSLGQRSLSGRIGYKHNSLSGGLSANYLSFDRLEGGMPSYYNEDGRVASPQDLFQQAFLGTKTYIKPDDAKAGYPELNLARRSVGINSFVTYEPNEKLSFVLTGGYQESRTLREYMDGDGWFSPMSTHDGQSWYLDLRSRAYNFTFQASFAAGHQLVPGNQGTFPDGITREKYETRYTTLDLNLDYDFVWEWLRVRPGVSYRRAQFSGVPFFRWDEQNTLVDDTAVIQSASVSVGLEQTLWKRLRFIEAVRLDVYFDRTEHNYYPSASAEMNPTTKHGQPLYPSFQFAVTYTPAEDHILRAAYGRANKSPCMIDSFYLNNSSATFFGGNNAVDLLTVDTVELGYRTRISQQIDLSVEVFGNYGRDFDILLYKGSHGSKYYLQYDNIYLKAWQLGATVTAGFTTKRLQGRLSVTVQQTRLEDLDPNIYRLYDVTYIPLDPENKKNLTNKWHEGTPDVFGGFYLNYQPLESLNLNLNAYFFSRHTQTHSKLLKVSFFNIDYSWDKNEVDIQQSFLLNVKVSYNFWNGLTAFINIRNLFNINQAQFAWGDANHILCLIGLHYEL